jgi:hypothetical protein
MHPGLPGQRLTFANRQKREFEHILNFLSSEEATNFKAKRIAFSSALTDGYCKIYEKLEFLGEFEIFLIFCHVLYTLSYIYRDTIKGRGMIRVDFGPISETVYIDIILNTIIER